MGKYKEETRERSRTLKSHAAERKELAQKKIAKPQKNSIPKNTASSKSRVQESQRKQKSVESTVNNRLERKQDRKKIRDIDARLEAYERLRKRGN